MEREVRQEIRLDEVSIRLHFRSKKRIFDAIRGFNFRNVRARNWMKTLIIGNERANVDTAFRRWKDFNN